MKMDVRDPGALNALGIDQITEYLRLHNWRERGTNSLGVSSWVYADRSGRKSSVILPPSADFDDYAERASELLYTLSVVEDRPELAIYNDILLIGSDTIRFRSKHPETEDGNIPLPDGIMLYQGAYDLLVAAATVVDQKRAYLPNRKPNEAMQYVQSTTIAPSERGSYVLVLHSRLNPNADIQHNYELIPYGRRVLQTLSNALTSLQNLADDIDPLTVGDHAIEENVGGFVREGGSLDLCQAIDELNKSAKENTVEITFSWSPQYPANEQITRSIVIGTRMAELSQRIGQTIRRQWIAEEKSIRGNVVRLVRGGEDYVADITIDGFIDNRRKRVRLHIRNREDHQLVIRAYETGRQVMCKGNLIRRGNYTLFDRYHDLQMVEKQS